MRLHDPAVAGVVPQIGLGPGRIDRLDPQLTSATVSAAAGGRAIRRRVASPSPA